MSELGGLPASTWDQIETVLARFPMLLWVKLYGSRAMGKQRPGSDVDLAFSSAEDCSAALAGALEELPIPYKVDVTHWESLSHAGLRRQIDVDVHQGQHRRDPAIQTIGLSAGCRSRIVKRALMADQAARTSTGTRLKAGVPLRGSQMGRISTLASG